LQGVDAVAAAVQLGTHRVHQKWQVMVQHFDRGVGRLPTMTFVIGVVDPHLGFGVVEALKQAPGRQGATGQVGKATLGQFVQGNDAEKLFSEQRHLWQCLFTDVLRQCRLQLMLEVGLAGCGERTPSVVLRLGFVIDGSVACYPLAGRPSALFAGNDTSTINESG